MQFSIPFALVCYILILTLLEFSRIADVAIMRQHNDLCSALYAFPHNINMYKLAHFHFTCKCKHFLKCAPLILNAKVHSKICQHAFTFSLARVKSLAGVRIGEESQLGAMAR